MKTIHKYVIGQGVTYLTMPEGAEILSAKLNAGEYCVWALIDRDAEPTETRAIAAYCTGGNLPDDPGRFIDTIVVPAFVGSFVVHIFEV